MKLKQRVVVTSTLLVICVFFLALRLLLLTFENNQDISQQHATPSDHHRMTSSKNHVTSSEDHVTSTINPKSIVKSNKTLLITPDQLTTRPWDIWARWVNSEVLYPVGVFYSSDMDMILRALSTYPIKSFDVGYRGTQLKATLRLTGNQKTVFKPRRYNRETIVDGPNDPYAGFDRHNGEIAAFHLEGILGYRLAPPVVGRKINLTSLLPVTSPLLHATYLQENGNTCFYGKCLYCKPAEKACADGVIMEGSVTIWLPHWYQLKTFRHPYQRTYIPHVKARWEKDDKYCLTLLKPTSDYYHLLPDILDTTVLDFLVGNADRHHFETYALLGKKGHLMHIDNGKSFGNPHHDELSILAPLKQCCRLRNSTWTKLLDLHDKGLSKLLESSLKRDPLYPILTSDHLKAIDRRLNIILDLVRDCIKHHGTNRVLFKNWENQ